MTRRPRPRRPLGCARQWTEASGMGIPGAGRTSRRGLRPTCRPGHGVGFPGEIRKRPNSAAPSPLEELGDVPAGVAATPVRPTEPQSRNSAIAAGVCGALFIGYCIYFDRKRRSDPNFKNRLRERRKKQKLAKERAGLSKLPDLKDAEAVQKFFLEEIQLGEELLAQGEYEKGVDHLTNAIAVCGQPQQLLQVLQQTLPPPVFQMLLTKLPTISQRIVSAQSLAEDDVE